MQRGMGMKRVKTRKKCCKSRPRCKRCPVVCKRLENAGPRGARGQAHYLVSLDVKKKTLKAARA